MKPIEEINLELQEATDAERQEQLDAEYEEFVAWMYYCFACEQMDEDYE